MSAGGGVAGRVLVLAGGLSHERDVSIRSGRRVMEALRDVGVEVELRDLDAALLPDLAANPPAVVLPMLHGTAGEDGTLATLLELHGLPYVGTGPAACRAAFDKPTAGSLLAAAGLSVPRTLTLPQNLFRDLGSRAVLQAVVADIGFPLVVRPARGGSALGCSIVRDWEGLPSAMVSCFAYGDDAIVQPYVAGTEVAVCLVDDGSGVQVLPPVEIVPDGGFYDYTARYTAGATEFFVPARLDDGLTAGLVDAAVQAHRVLRLRHLTRVDCIVDEAGVPWVLEVNTAPGMTETSMFPLAVDAAGLRLGSLLTGLVGRLVPDAREPAGAR